jgi:hypothetical protein
MSSIRAWILLLAATSFLAGLAAGLWIARARAPRDAGPFAPYATRLEQAFDLDAQRARWLRTALAQYAGELEALGSRGGGPQDAELVQAGQRCTERIREFVIPADRRDEFDRLAGGQLHSTGAHH